MKVVMKAMMKATPRSTDLAPALHHLLEGNRRHVRRRERPSATRGPQTTDDVLAAVLVCSDLGVAVDELFDLPVGALYVMQNAAAVVGAAEAAGAELAVRRHGVDVLLVLGHAPCPALSWLASGAAGAANSQLALHAPATPEGAAGPPIHEAHGAASLHAARMAAALRARLPPALGLGVYAGHLDEGSGLVSLLPE